MAGGYLQSAVIGVTALFGEQALQRYFTGQGAVGIVVSIVQYVSTAISVHGGEEQEQEDDHSLTLFGFIFFGLATLYMVVSLIAHSTLVRTPLYRSVVLFKDQKVDPETVDDVVVGDSVESVDNDNGNSDDGTENDQAFLSRSIQLHRRMSITSQLVKDDDSIVTTWKIAKMNVLYNASVCLVYVVTLSVFPPITSTILSVNSSSQDNGDNDNFFLSPTLFISLHFFIFNIGDFIGRAIAYPTHLAWWNQSPNDLKLFIASISRILFIPLFLICNIIINNNNNNNNHNNINVNVDLNIGRRPDSTLPPLIHSDVVYMIILLLFAISNGYLMNIAMMGVSSVEYNYWLRSLVEEQQVKLLGVTGPGPPGRGDSRNGDGNGNGTLEVDLAAKVAQFCLIGGLLLGSIMSFGVKSMVCGGCNPFYG